MDKPEFLTGEVKSFEEEIIILDSTEELITDYGHELFLEMHRFYTQPFTRSLITELFEGWELVESLQNKLFRFKNGTNKINILYWIDYWTKTGTPEVTQRSFSIPRTLNDFINDCHRSEITLQWKNNL
jgi:hypothetical protein